jgi:hypothetical protein
MTLPTPRPRYQGEPSAYRPAQQHHVEAQRQLSAPTLGQYWRSDSRVVPGRKRPTWAGRVALWLGMLAAILFFAGLFVNAVVLVAVATPIGIVAILFALIAIIAGVGRASGIFGLIFALAGSSIFWAWLERTFG